MAAPNASNMEQDYYTEWTCECGVSLRAFFKPDAVRGPHFQEHTIDCPVCGKPKDLVPAPYRLDRQGGDSSWTTAWVK
jgi:hypothetical protein